MTSTEQSSTDPLCGPRVRVVYVWRGDKMVYSEIARPDVRLTSFFPGRGHFLVRITKALVKTTQDVEVYESGDHCTLQIFRSLGGPKITDMDMDTINKNCEIQGTEKMKQIQANQTYPVVAENFRTKSIFAKEFQPETKIKCKYGPHLPEHLDRHPIGARPEYSNGNKTANMIEFSPPFILFYGDKYEYNIDMKTVHKNKLTEDPRMIICFYGHIYDTTNNKLTGLKTNYFEGLQPYICDIVRQHGLDYISDVDNFDDHTDYEDSEDDDFYLQPMVLLPQRK